MTAESGEEPITIPITGELDLHTFRPQDTTRLLDDYFAACRQRGLLTVRVVHGKGAGALRETVHTHLRRSPLVLGFFSGERKLRQLGCDLGSAETDLRGSRHRSSRPDAAGHSAVVVPSAPGPESGMGTKFIYAIALTLSQAVFSLLMYFLGFQTEKMATGQYFQWVPLIITIVVLWLALSAIREENEGHYLTYGQGVGAGTLISFISGLMSAVYTYIHFKFINPNFTDYQIEFMRGKWTEKGMTDSQMEQAETMMRKFSGAGIYAAFTPIIALFFGVLISLVIAAILKRNPPEDRQTA